MIAAQELGRYGVTVNCLAPNARTRMTEVTFGELATPEDGFDPLDPGNMAPLVVALCADEAQDITGQCFFVWGGVVNVLRPWEAGEPFAADGRWDADELLSALRDRFPDGAAPDRHARGDGEGRRPLDAGRADGHQLTLQSCEGATDYDLGASDWVTVEQSAIEASRRRRTTTTGSTSTPSGPRRARSARRWPTATSRSR